MIRAYGDWEDLGEVPDPRIGRPLNVEFDPKKFVPLTDGPAKKGMKVRGLSLNEKTVGWLARAIPFMQAYVEAMNKVKGLPKLAP